MAEKTFLAKEKLAIMACDTPAKAKRLGQKLTLRSDWEDVPLRRLRCLVHNH